ncbi:response regulator [Azorhizobium sp. AG788]|uniref:response regulator transcription factor n=1 Tax=Azorhizobium sp. AG788 TaxID=2183897 RepID=UPI003139FF44
MSLTPTISIVDDDDSVRLAVSSLVRSLGFKVSTFASAEEFLTSDVMEDTSCLVSDIQMPGMSGLDLQKVLIQRQCRIPIIFITAFPEDAVRRRAEAAGAIGFLSKPFDGQAMIECLTAALERPPHA